MRLLARLLWVLVVFPIGGCNEVTTPTAPLLLTVTGYDVDWEKAPLEGVEICETDTGNCKLTDANGQAALELPLDEEVSYTFEKNGYGSYILADLVRSDGEQRGMGMRTDEHLKMQFERVDSPYPMKPGTGRILLQVSEREFAGVTFELVNATGKPYYYDEERNWDPNLTATTPRGWGGFVEVSPGDRFRFHVIYGGTAQRCVPYVGWPGEANSVWFPVREGYTTTVDMICPPPLP